MGWMQRLVSAYDDASTRNAFTELKNPLVEVGFIEKRADVMVTLNRDGTFREAERLVKGDNDVINMPTTPEAESRTSSKLPPFPLFDGLVYMTDGYDGKDAALHVAYVDALRAWAEQEDAPEALKVFYGYISRGCLLNDLISAGFKVEPQKEAKQLYCFRVIMEDGQNERIWQREDIRESWRRRSGALRGGERLCYVEGRQAPILQSHPKLFGNSKLISSQDDATIFQYKGRFTEPDEAVQVSYDASVKANNALLWLMKRQGFNRYGIQAVAWRDGGGRVTLPIADEGEDDEGDTEPRTFAEFGVKIRGMLEGRRQAHDDCGQVASEKVSILALTAATPGRVSVTYYQELTDGDYVNRLIDWYTACSWGFSRFCGTKDDRRMWRGVSTPTPMEIAVAVYGKRLADTARSDLRNEKSATKIVRELKLRLLHCMVDGAALPKDLLLAAFHRVSAPQGFRDDNGKWLSYDWNLALSTYCAMLNKHLIDEGERVTDVVLDRSCTDRSYLYGRMLAVADMAERDALGRDNYRETNAFRYMQLFRQRPFATWTKLHTLALPYFAKLRGYSERYKRELGDIMVLFEPNDYESSKPLDGRYLQGYYCQRQAFYNNDDKPIDKPTDTAGTTDK